MPEVDINTASVYELEHALHNRERAQEILNKREQFGDFKDWDDLREKVHGMSDRLISELSDSGVTVGVHRSLEAPAPSRRRVRPVRPRGRANRAAGARGSS
jgi:Helix-hairpin-helix motif